MSATEQKPRKSRWLRWALAAVVVIALAIPVGLVLVSRGWLSPLAKREVERALQEKYHRDLKLGSLEVSLFPEFRVVGTAVSLDHKSETDADAPPLIQMQRFVAETGWLALLRAPRIIRRVRLEGLQIHILPRGERKPHEHDASPPEPKQTPFIIQEIIADGTQLQLHPKKAGKEPLVFDIHKLTLKSVGNDRPMHYTAKLDNAKPPGVIDAKGDFGPWNTDDSGMTPLTGEYTFKDADLSAFKGMSGKLSSKGEFHGVLEKIEVNGTTDTPDFTISKAGHPVHLKTEFSATVDGVTSDTLLHPVTAHFGQTTVRAEGGVIRKEGAKGRTVALDAVTRNGSLADVMKLGVKAKPPLTGRISFRTKILIPPGDSPIADKLMLSGQFDVQSGQFTNPDTQRKIINLSQKAQGPEKGDEEDVRTSLSGRFSLDDNMLGLAGLTFSVPGADIRLDGTYGVETEALDMKGTATTQARISQMTSGIKSIFLKAVDPFFAKNGAGAVIPIKIGGTRDQPTFGLRLRN